MVGKVFNVNQCAKPVDMVQIANSSVIVETMEVHVKHNQVGVFASKDILVRVVIDLVPKVFMVLDVNKPVFPVLLVMGLAII